MKVRVLYNKSCKICKSEIDHYKKHCNDDISWVDVIQNKEVQILTSKSEKQLIRRMHIIKDGEIIEGARAFLEIWKLIPRYNFLYKIFKIKIFYFILFIFYEFAALFLFIKNKHLIKWIKIIYRQEFVLFVANYLHGGKNGERIGKMSNIVQRDVQTDLIELSVS